MEKRLDQILATRYPHVSKTLIQSLIAQGKVTVAGKTVTKAGTQVAEDVVIEVDLQEPKYVSRAGFKLEKAVDHFGIDVAGKTVLDAGLSTGGFADCLLQRGAKKIYGVDVGYGQVHEKIRTDARVAVIERTNLRSMSPLPELVDLVTLDLSFISVLKVMDTVVAALKPQGELVVLIKPQFEARKDQVGKGGVIKDAAVHQEVLDRVIKGIEYHDFACQGWTPSPIEGATGNKEFLAYLGVDDKNRV